MTLAGEFQKEQADTEAYPLVNCYWFFVVMALIACGERADWSSTETRKCRCGCESAKKKILSERCEDTCPNYKPVTDVKGTYEKVNGDENAAPVMNTARVDVMPPSTSASEMVTSPFSERLLSQHQHLGWFHNRPLERMLSQWWLQHPVKCDAAKHFVQDMVMETKKIEQILFQDIKEMIPLTSEENYACLKANICHICKKGDFIGDNYKVRDHDHLTGKFRGAAHNEYRLEDNCLPPKENFFSKLTNEHITEEDYNHAKSVWETFNIQTVGEYSDLYLKSDTLILTDVFENFREMCLKAYDLDCMYYYTVPGLAYSAMLKLTGVELQLIKDMTMLLLFEQGIRGGICQCVTRHAIANDPKSDNFDDSKPPSTIYYVDANNLYGFAMSQKLPYGGFAWLTDEEIRHFDLQAVNDDSEIGYVLEVDIDYPNHLFEKHKELPFCAEFAKPPGGKHKKLLTTLHSKKKLCGTLQTFAAGSGSWLANCENTSCYKIQAITLVKTIH
ncbi:hypothetical protein ANN_23049 [Periplaneta americana]|uniref:DNA-directed DNA polymerase n=1 Tax=Periplaneta americana TaxID=6978 RepID=A0ABQ8SK49_PERAM|nr:hypothetical protein ANN_23049 [Periplaneta americana]